MARANRRSSHPHRSRLMRVTPRPPLPVDPRPHRQPVWQKLLLQAWSHPSWYSRALLAPWAALYAWVLRWRQRHAAVAQSVGVPVIVVGNVVVGGGGKTPVVIELTRHLLSHQLRVGVIARGYGRVGVDTRLVRPSDTAAMAGDEAVLVHRRTGVPVAVGRQRVDAARALLRAYPDVQVIVSDDGLQHQALARNLELLVFDERGLGNGCLLPAGPLREPWPRRADACLVRADTPDLSGFVVTRRLADFALDANQQRHPLLLACATARAHGLRVQAWAGIAHPEAFFTQLHGMGLNLDATLAWPDHARFDEAPSLAANSLVLCTEKDAVKLWASVPSALAVPLICTLGPDFWDWFDAQMTHRMGLVLSQLSSHHGHSIA